MRKGRHGSSIAASRSWREREERDLGAMMASYAASSCAGAIMGGLVTTRLRSPNTLSTRAVVGQNLDCRTHCAGNAACRHMPREPAPSAWLPATAPLPLSHTVVDNFLRLSRHTQPFHPRGPLSLTHTHAHRLAMANPAGPNYDCLPTTLGGALEPSSGALQRTPPTSTADWSPAVIGRPSRSQRVTKIPPPCSPQKRAFVWEGIG